MDKLQTRTDRRDYVVGALVFAGALALYVRTLAPTVAFLFDDTLEFQYVVPRLGILHPTGYPFYTLLGKLFTLVVPLNDPAYRLNLLSALIGALAVAMVYFIARHLTSHRLAALLPALTFAVGQTFWSQAVVAETYTTQMLIVAVLIYVALIWREEFERGNTARADRRLYLLALVMGLGLTHHRLLLLLYPAIGVYVLLVDRRIWRDWKVLGRAALLFLAPLVLYLYLPLRGAVGSADGTYENTLAGFFAWVTGQKYAVFLTENPFQIQRGAAYYLTLFQNQFGAAGTALAAVGVVWLLRTGNAGTAGRREWVLLSLALAIQAVFVFNYRVANVHVHFLTTFLLVSLFIGAGTDALASLVSGPGKRLSTVAFALLAVLLLLIPLNLLNANYAVNDLSSKWDIHDYGMSILSQPLEQNSTIIGLQGEISLIRYLQETQGLRPDLRTIAADAEGDRLAAVDQAMAENRVVYLTRPLQGVTAKYSLGSAGQLIRVRSQAAEAEFKISHPLDEDFGHSVKLVGYDLNTDRLEAIPGRWHTENGRYVDVTLYWKVMSKIDGDAMVSVKLLGRDERLGQIDHHPVQDAYPTSDWRVGEIIPDTFAVPVFLGVPPGAYTLNVTLYSATSGVVVGQKDLEKIIMTPDFVAPRRDLGPDRAAPQREAWNIAHIVDADFGAFGLAGYSLDTDTPVRPGDALPLTLLWRAHKTPIVNSLHMRVWLEDSEGTAVASRDTLLGDEYPVAQWQSNQYVRDWPLVRVPANVADGKYAVKLAAARVNEFLGGSWSPWGATTVSLGQVAVKNRLRIMTPVPTDTPVDAIFGGKAKLLGYNIERDVPQRGVRITLVWRSLALMDTSYTVFVHLLDSKGSVIVSGDAIPAGGDLPTTGWIEGEYVADVHSFTLPADLPEGDYPIEVGLYDPITGARLKTADGQDRVILLSLTSG